MYKLNPLDATPELQPGLRMAPLAMLVAAIVVTGCHAPPASSETQPQTGHAQPHCVPMNPTSKYSVYWSKDRVEAVEEIPSGLERCIVAVAQPPGAPTSPPASAPTPACSSPQVPSPAAAYYVDYYKGEPTVPLQIEDLRSSPQRCITNIPPYGGSDCPPPAGRHKVLINGVVYCVPN